jgi:hypothetical protein
MLGYVETVSPAKESRDELFRGVPQVKPVFQSIP